MLAPFIKTIETVTLTFDFSNFSTSVSNPVISVTSIGVVVDSNPSSILVGSATVSGAQVLQQVAPTIDGTLYQVECLATMATGGDKYAEPIVFFVYKV